MVEESISVLKKEILRLAERRGHAKSFCPSEVARALDETGDWRKLMPGVRKATQLLAQESRVKVTQKGTDVDPLEARGPIRIRLHPDSE